MGCFGSFVSKIESEEFIDYVHIYDAVPMIKLWQPVFEGLALSQHEVGRFYKIFRVIDKDTSLSISILELLMFLNIERTRFTIATFSVFGTNNL